MKKSPFIIAVSGDPVAGKSSAIQALMERYAEEGMAIGAREEGNCVIKLSAGQMYRDLAEQSQINKDGLTPFEFLNGYATIITYRSIDLQEFHQFELIEWLILGKQFVQEKMQHLGLKTN